MNFNKQLKFIKICLLFKSSTSGKDICRRVNSSYTSGLWSDCECYNNNDMPMILSELL